MKKSIYSYLIIFATTLALCIGYILLFKGIEYHVKTVVYQSSTLNPQYLFAAGLRFGDEKELNELIEIVSSVDVRAKVYQKIKNETICHFCDLEEHGAIKILENATHIERGMNRSLNITIKDKDPELAALIANVYIEASYEHLSEMVMESVYPQLVAVKILYEEKLQEINVIQDTLQKLETLGESKVVQLVQVKSPRYRFYDTQYEAYLKRLTELNNYKEQLEEVIQKDVPKFFVINTARAADAKIDKLIFIKALFISLFITAAYVAFQNRKHFYNFIQN